MSNLKQSISSSTFYYKKIISNIDVENLLIDPASVPCHCKDSPFKDQYHYHILTGNLKIVNDSKLLKIFSRDPK